MNTELLDLWDMLSYRKITGDKMTKVELEIIELSEELFEAAYPGPPGLPQEVLSAMEQILKLREAS